MRVFVAGATGAIGRFLVPRLAGAGHEVTALTRSAAKTAALRAAGATPVVADALDAEAVRAVVADARPDVVVDELTDLPEDYDVRDLGATYTRNTAVRDRGSRALLAAAQAAGARRFVAQSVAFMYAPDGDFVKDEDAPLMTGAPGALGAAQRTYAALEAAVVGAEGLDGLILRYGFFYGPGTYYARGESIARDFMRRRSPVVGAGTGLFSFIHVDDAATATVAAVERGRPGIYNVVDDHPAPMREWVPVYARALGAPRPLRVPRWVSRLAAGSFATSMATGLRGASNAKARRELGWAPAHPSWREGFAAALAAHPDADAAR